ncbi:hypothetical protein DSL64_16330 [Dyadobacter luteus]|uniref:Secretion system C-terminal sorting domain-containing protein n=1 Tax=Dyadobacter luteus TaxID=2259619 RepID=A0A3D8Y8Z5_9BACT|nr:T9SS type A sorting domain-containing protein [Dyadobacter luteus]REA59879.1 hypothetical protein DSL64_16330 [Dyadobacter luteus]
MKRTFIRKGFFACIVTLLAAASSIAQTSITTGVVTPASICPGGNISVAFTFVGAVLPTNSFAVQLSDATGSFSSASNIGTGTASPITGVIPANSTAGTAYKVRVVSVVTLAPTVPVITGTESTVLTVNAIPAAPTFTAPPSYVTGATAVALAATGVTGSTLNWYDSADSPLAGAPVPTTTAVGTQTYKVSQTVGGCEGPKATISVTVTACTPPALPTTTATVNYTVGDVATALAATGVTGSTLNWYSSSDSPLAGAPVPTTTAAGVQTYKVSQTVGGCESAKLTITVTIAACTPPAVPTTTTSINYTVGDVATALTATGLTGSTIKWYSATDSPLSAAPVPTTTAVGTQTYKVSQTVSGCESAKVTITVTVAACTPPAVPTTTTSVNYTVGDVATALTATGLTGSTIKWYSATDSPLSAAPVPTTTAVGTQTYKVSQTVGGCESAKVTITVTVAACTPPAVPTTTTSVNYTVGDVATALTATGLTGSTIKWYSATDSPLSAAPVPTTTAVGTQTYKVSQTVGGCESAKVTITVTVAACTPPAIPTTTTSINYTVGDVATALTATGLTGSTIKWYSATDSPLSAAPVPTTTAVGTQTYKVSQTVGGCESAKVTITVTVSACVLSAAPAVTSPTSYCASTTPVAALAATGTAIKWYNASQVPLPSAPVPNVNVSVTTSTTYYVTQTEAGKCESAKKEVIITVNKTVMPVVSVDPVEYCVGETATALTATGTGLIWYSGATGPATISPIPVTTTPGNQVFYVSQTLNGCESERARIDVRIKARPATPAITALAPVCLDQTVAPSVILGAVTPATGLSWYTVSTGGSATATPAAVSTSTAGVKNYYVTQTVNGCESATRGTVSIEVKALPAAPTVTPLAFCKDEPNTAALTATGTALKWYSTLTSTPALSTVPVPVTATVGTVSYYVSQTAGYTGTTLTCESPRAKLDVVTNALPATLTAFSEALCQEKEDKTFTFTATPAAATGNTIVWYSAATGTATALPTLNLKNSGETTVYAVQKITATGCESPARVSYKLRVKPLPALPTVSSALIEYCQFLPAVALTATPVATASLNWYGNNATGGTASAVAPIPSTAEGGTKSYYVSQTLEGCQGDRAKIDVKINTTPKPVTKTYLEYCQGVTAPILDATGTVLKWYRQFTDTEFQGYPYTPFTEKVEDYSFWVTQTGTNNCESPKEEIKIHIKAKPSATISGNTQIDLGQTANITLNFTADGPWTYILSDGKTGTSNQATISIPVTPAATTNYFVTEVKNSCGIGTPMGTAQVTVRIPTIITGSPSVAEACAGKTFTVPFQQSGDFPTGNTFKIQIAQENLDAKFYSIPSVATGNSITATFPDTTKGGFYFVRVINSGTNASFDTKGSVNTIGITVSPLPVATISGTQTVFVGSPATLKVEITGKAPWSFTLSNGTKDSVITAAASPYSFVMSPRTTTTYTIASATNTCGVGRGAGSARVQVDPILGLEPTGTAWLRVYPTVANPECIVEMTAETWSKDANIKILDLNGRSIHTQPIRTKTTTLEFSKYPSGLYLLQVEDGNRRSVNRVMKP